MKRWMCVAIGLLVAGCSGEEGAKVGDSGLTKAEARSMGGTSDTGEDLCDEFDWYGDGICDEFCVDEDEDCDSENNENNDPENNDPDNNDPDNNDPDNNANNLPNNNTTNNSTNNTSGGDCGGFAGLTCADDEFCDYDEGDFCGAADALGQCMPRPENCTREYDPVCGCDGMTYSNECSAQAAGTDAAASGECATACADDADCAVGQVCLNGVCSDDPNTDVCGGIAGIQCAAGQFCNYDEAAMCGAADQQGVCEAIPQACPDVYLPVCGCDGTTYSNECDAHAAGVSVAEEGECEVACTANDDCARGQLCVNGICEDVGMGQCGGFAGFVCAADEWCDYPDASMCGAADQLGDCKPRPDACIQVFDPVCGCDGQTHSNACMAHAAGVDVMQDGACP